ncbi:sigma-70 family RNA polymerase sigma factor [Pigmentiphaga sp.]|uniref:RNA polymerase sigma factor n=1 Tax=Pigmentiphaga sp. TaxID=1977564 RepID=UPI00128E596C|nr:sigma-70 family RNA polymerase sigma factor [Pigmentiphaga sp.]MPS26605.1 sigma-70 family RNA polymerase sigma factor [Alcaligenaceae bacterium SAGV5]MPS53631.1 sigma-70 family RNA polymerase sigma factor [Alcaligenaceae bacterium SAGV3]MPT57948.1 sigma-70 family RNA polymerase sigma factor [Alcaligenaceae bacterium]
MTLSAVDCLEAPDAVDGVAGDSFAEDAGGVVLRDFLAANYARLHRRLQRHLGCPDLASECLHEAWLRLGEIPLRAVVQNPDAYVYRIAFNLAMDHLRNRRPWQDAADAGLEHMVDHAPGPDVIAEARSDVQAVERAMQRLPHRHRLVLVALRIEEKTRQEVADWYRISLRNVDTTLRQALEQCAQASGQTVRVGVGSSRRWREKVAAVA